MFLYGVHDHPLEIRCPRCGGRALWEEPFAFRSLKNVPEEDRARMVRWGGWLVLEKFPSIIRWTPPRHGAGYGFGQVGVVRCWTCYAVVLHRLRWPADALFQWSVRGVTLYACNAEHARVLLHYIGATLRDPHRYGERYRKGLQRLPTGVMKGHARERLAGQIAASLRAYGLPLGPPPGASPAPAK
jgi:hypothetical protein